MMNYRNVALYALSLILALSLSACNSDSDPVAAADDSADESIVLDITGPISSSTMDTTDEEVTITGSASSDTGIYQVTWENDKGGQGVANGTESWKIADLGLELGENQITVTAEDTAGRTKSKRIKVKRESRELGSATLTWNPPTARVDGTPLTNLAGYKIYYGRMSGIYDYEIDVNNPGLSTYVVENLVSGEWFFALAAYDADGLESEPSNEVLREIS